MKEWSKWLWVKFCVLLGWFGIRWKTSQIDCDLCHKPISIFSDLTINAHVNPDQSVICMDCLDMAEE